MTREQPVPLTQRAIFLFWVPLAATWAMMAVEGPFLAAVIARMAEAKFNLAAYGVSFAFALLMEAPVIMLMSASNALVEDGGSYRKLRNFMRGLNGGATALLLVVLIPPIFDLFAYTVLALPVEVASRTYGALWLFLPWPAAIGYRRFLQGLLIRAGRTRLVALGTVFRVSGMAAAALLLYGFAPLEGAWLGAAALSTGVVVEAIAARVMAGPTIRELLHRGPSGTRGATHQDRPAREAAGAIGTDPAGLPVGEVPPAPATPELTYPQIVDFYVPLVLTSMIGLSLQPVLTFFMGRAPQPVESLAVFPVVHSLSFFFRALGLSYLDTTIALIGKRFEHFPELARFAWMLALGTTGGLALIAFTPLSYVWFETISGLSRELADFSLLPTRILVPIPALSVLLYFLRAILVQGRRTRPVTVASAIEVGGVAIIFAVLGWGWEVVGVTAAFLAFLGGRAAGDVYLLRSAKRVLGEEASR